MARNRSREVLDQLRIAIRCRGLVRALNPRAGRKTLALFLSALALLLVLTVLRSSAVALGLAGAGGGC